MQIGLYFGSFNPIHNGHLAIAKYVLEHTHLQEVWFVVSPQNPFKINDVLLPEQHRLRMVELAIQQYPAMKASDVEFALPKPSYTYDTLQYLAEHYPHHSFALMMGADNAERMHEWKNATQLLGHYPIYVYPRDNDTPITTQHPGFHYVKAPLYPISSTQIRMQIAHNIDVSAWLHPPVYAYINEHHLYK
jgi:nicotinate-nucleotide adenylyltransferase